MEPRCSSCSSEESLDVCDMPEASWIGVFPVLFSVKAPLAMNNGKIHEIEIYSKKIREIDFPFQLFTYFTYFRLRHFLSN